ncbi:MAG TPA: hypothetical protein VGE51_14610 [Fontimonas sp.]
MLKAGFAGALAVLVAVSMSSCGGGGGGSASTSTLTLSGKIVAPLPDAADVTARVGAKPYLVKADAEGDFTVTIESSDPDALVTLETKLVGDLSFVELLGDLGNFSALLEAAGDDATLTAAENIRTNISSLSTAEAVLIDEAEAAGKAGRKTFTFGEGVDPEEALTLAALIELAVNDPDEFALPQAAPTTLDLARSAATRDAFRDDIEERAPDRLETAKQDLVGNVDVIGPARASDVPPDLLAAQLDDRGEFPFNRGGVVDGLEFVEDGSGVYFSNRPSVGMSWSLDGTRLKVELDEPVVATSFERVDCSGTGSFEVRESQLATDRLEIVRLSAAAVGVTAHAIRTTADCAASPSATVTSTVAKTALKPETLQSFSAADVSGRSVVLPVLATADQLGNTQLPDDLLDFASAGSGSGRYTAPAFSWSVANGVLSVDYGNGIVGRYRPVLGIDDTARVVLADYVTPSGRFADLAISFPRDPAFSFVAATVPARYFQFGIGAENGGDERLDGFRLRLDADGKGAQEDDSIDASGNVVDSVDGRGFSWSLSAAGEVVVERRFLASNPAQGCDPAGGQTCVLFDRRVLVPVSRDGERYYLLERRRIDRTGVDAGDLQIFVARFYDRVPLDTAKRASAR